MIASDNYIVGSITHHSSSLRCSAAQDRPMHASARAGETRKEDETGNVIKRVEETIAANIRGDAVRGL